MKTIIGLDGKEVEVADNIITKSIDGIDYLLTPEDESERAEGLLELKSFQTKEKVKDTIRNLEVTLTSRRLRDALASDEGKTWVADVEKLIAIERAKL